MSATDTHNDPARPEREGFIENTVTGLKVLGAELKLMLTGILRRHETRQVRRRLEKEYAALGRLARAHVEGAEDAPLSTDGEAGIILSQIAFLEKEIDFMDEETERNRDESRREMRRGLGLDKTN